jgi:catechol 2,3-dioxygenase-like lactoylglutathione lyase family enzyme
LNGCLPGGYADADGLIDRSRGHSREGRSAQSRFLRRPARHARDDAARPGRAALAALPAPEREAVGYNHLCLEVADLDVALRELEAAGVPLAREKQMGQDGNWQAWIEDPDGHRIELMQMMPDSLQAKALAGMNAGA